MLVFDVRCVLAAMTNHDPKSIRYENCPPAPDSSLAAPAPAPEVPPSAPVAQAPALVTPAPVLAAPVPALVVPTPAKSRPKLTHKEELKI